jgi:hypothetical protein
MPALRGITVAVGEFYARTLEICLVRNMRHLAECVVVTTPGDEAVKTVAAKVPDVRVFETNAFYEHGAVFNKGWAAEQGFDFLGRHGWIVIFDADIIFPSILPLHLLVPGKLYGARRRILPDVSMWKDDLDWRIFPLHPDGGPIGFFQAAHADDPAIRDKRPWYNVNYPHAGGCDAQFMDHWPPGSKVVLNDFVCLHLGPPDRHWFGTSPEAQDQMARYVKENRWSRAMANFPPEAAARAQPVIDRVDVPGYPMSDYRMPFEKRAMREREGK